MTSLPSASPHVGRAIGAPFARVATPTALLTAATRARLLMGLLALLALLLPASRAFAAVRVVFDIDMSEEIRAGRFDPARDTVGVRGGAAPLSWTRSLIAPAAGLGREGRYTATAVFERIPAGGNVPYKFRVERPGQGEGEDGWETGGNRSLELVAEEVRVARAFNAPGAPISLSRAGRIDRLDPLPERFVAPRAVQVWLPPGYEQDPRRRYPVLYLHDGQNVFDAAAAGAEWQVDETAQQLVVSGQIRPLIIVAVNNTPQRIDDYTATAMSRDGHTQGGKGPAYARYLIEQLKPDIDARYRTLPDAAHTAVGGSSLGGIMSLWLAMHHNDVFGAALVISPSLWWDNEFPIRDVASTPLPMGLDRPRLWLDMGVDEGPQAIRQLRKLRAQLFARGWQRTTLNYVEVPGGTHDEASWAARFGDTLRFLDRQVWDEAGRKEPLVGQDPFPPKVMPDIKPRRGSAW